ncbi:4-alpha-glucanotransferase [Streptomyces albireticuli]|uniref:4-alpha-glucanotransferase n=1 Tax=Streptomyces albireticuli TaxID=1940 RepID=UPI0036C2EBFF
MGRARLAALHGVATSYEPSPGDGVPVPEDTVVAVLAALGVDASTPRSVRDALEAHDRAERHRLLPATVVLRSRAPEGARGTAPASALRALPEGTALRVDTEDGGSLPWTYGDAAAPELPLGRHLLRAHAPDGRAATASLIVAPRRLPTPPGRGHGFLVQLYSLLSARSWGMGDLGDLAELAAWSGRAFGSDFVQVNPLHAAVPGTGGAPTDPSPYRPSSRRFPDPVHLRVEDVTEFAYLTGAHRDRADQLLTRAAALRDAVLTDGELIDRDAVWALKRRALELVRAVPMAPGRRAAYDAFLAGQGQALDDHSTWCALAEVHGPDWRSWPGGLKDPRSARTAQARCELLDRVDFHCWLAWLTDQQLAAAQRAAREAGMRVGLVHDLAVGVHPSGADAWAQQDAFAAGMSVGAPPDAFNSRGQDWGLPPWRPDALEATGYGPYRDLLRALLRHAGALRVDHVMGLFRLWWVPRGMEPARGTYVRYDPEAMLGVLALEAHRANAAVVGEDLGTVGPGVREELAERGVLGTSVLWFERDYGRAAGGGPAEPLEPARWRTECLATATTHDLPSTAARLTGEHVELRHRLGLLGRPLAEEQREDAREVAEWLALFGRLGLLPEGPYDEEAAVRAVHRYLLMTPARMTGVWLPDAVGDRRPQNLPGTWDEYPNWRLPIADASGRPVSLEELTVSPRLHTLMEAVRGRPREDGGPPEDRR